MLVPTVYAGFNAVQVCGDTAAATGDGNCCCCSRLTDAKDMLHGFGAAAGAVQCQECHQAAFCSAACQQQAAARPWLHAAATCR